MRKRTLKQLPIIDLVGIIVSLILIGTPFWVDLLSPSPPTAEEVEKAARAFEAVVRSGKSVSEWYSQTGVTAFDWLKASPETRKRLVEALLQRIGGWSSCIEVNEFTEVLTTSTLLIFWDDVTPQKQETLEQRYEDVVHGLEMVLLDLEHPQCVKQLWSRALGIIDIRILFLKLDFLRSHFLGWILEALKRRLIKLEDLTEVAEIISDPAITQTPGLQHLVRQVSLILKEYEGSTDKGMRRQRRG